MPTENPNVLIVDDNPGDILLIKESLAGSGLAPVWHEARTAEEALMFFERLENTGQEWKPALVLLDITMPIFKGFHVLDFIKGAVRWREVPVVMWTSSALANDKETSRIFGADAYFTKPMELDAYKAILHTIFQRYIGKM